ncbi:MAG: serine hydrolase [Pseudomonadota bacterium]
MKPLRTALLLLVLGLGAWGVVLARGELQVVVGYSAKQLCSGVFVSGLSEAFLIETDILPRLAILGPARSWLSLRADRTAGFAEAGLLGLSARAVHTGSRGCVLHGQLPGMQPNPLPEPGETVPVPPALRAAFEAVFSEPAGAGRNTLAVLVSQHGELIAEQYREPVNTATPMQGWSMNKSLMVTWIGMQAEAGRLDPTRRVADLDPSIPVDTATTIGVDERLTLLHLLQMESGLDFAEIYGPGSDVTKMLYRSDTMWTVPAGVGQEFAPGQHFAYSSGDTVLASHLWQQSLDEPYERWIETNFSTPLGIASLVAESDASGTQVGSSYIYMTARDWLRVGQLWLDAWHGRAELLSQGWLRASVSARPSDRRGRYGRGFWLNTGGVAFAGLPENLFFASGNSGQYVVVVPEWELVVVRLGLTGAMRRSFIGEFLGALADLQRTGALEKLTTHSGAESS